MHYFDMLRGVRYNDFSFGQLDMKLLQWLVQAFFSTSYYYSRYIMVQDYVGTISLRDVYRTIELPIVGKMYDEFFPPTKLILDKKLLASLQESFGFGHTCL